MEDTLWESGAISDSIKEEVLILVLMEDTLWDKWCYHSLLLIGLNPCFNGRYSLSYVKKKTQNKPHVLILVLMEDTLWGY